MRLRMMAFCRASNARLNDDFSSLAGSSPKTVAEIAALAALTLSRRSSLRCSSVASSSRPRPADSILAAMSGSTVIGATTHFSLPAFLTSSSCAAQSFLISSCAMARASRMVSSSTSLAPDSTIEMASAEPATIRSRSDSSISCSVGLMTNSSSISPIRTAPMGPWNGKSETISAADAPLMHRMSNALT